MDHLNFPTLYVLCRGVFFLKFVLNSVSLLLCSLNFKSILTPTLGIFAERGTLLQPLLELMKPSFHNQPDNVKNALCQAKKKHKAILFLSPTKVNISMTLCFYLTFTSKNKVLFKNTLNIYSFLLL